MAVRGSARRRQGVMSGGAHRRAVRPGTVRAHRGPGQHRPQPGPLQGSGVREQYSQWSRHDDTSSTRPLFAGEGAAGPGTMVAATITPRHGGYPACGRRRRNDPVRPGMWQPDNDDLSGIRPYLSALRPRARGQDGMSAEAGWMRAQREGRAKRGWARAERRWARAEREQRRDRGRRHRRPARRDTLAGLAHEGETGVGGGGIGEDGPRTEVGWARVKRGGCVRGKGGGGLGEGQAGIGEGDTRAR